ncbi:MAG: ABC transporter ATP-binding protein [Coriobacteriales bacterium]|jgi:putative ABC transport system ATP-binding protein|nr:ABC transporter ATP-binding protein [Coriobacteriales bacterium]
MIELVDLYKVYQMGDEEVRALDGVSLRVDDGEFVGIVGPSGSGKSTLMHIIGCLDTADRGAYYLDGQPVEAFSENELARIRNRRIGFVFQSFNLIGRMSIEENVELPLVYSGTKAGERRERAREVLELVGLWERRNHTPNSISGGQQQRAAIARAIITNPSLILADEPTGNLDSRTGAEIIAVFKALNRAGKTIVLITHDAKVAAQAGRTVQIMDGRLYEDEVAMDSAVETGGLRRV